MPLQPKTGGSWDFPLCKDEKAWRLTQLFRAEIDQGQSEVRAVMHENNVLRRKLDAEDSADSCDTSAFATIVQGEKCFVEVDYRDQEPKTNQLKTLQRLCSEQAQELEVLNRASSRWEDDKHHLQSLHRAEVQRAYAELGRQTIEMNQSLATHQQREVELKRSLVLLREFGNEDFMSQSSRVRRRSVGSAVPATPRTVAAAPLVNTSSDAAGSVLAFSAAGSASSAGMSSVLIAVELDLGTRNATLNVAPWQTVADFDCIVKDFLCEHQVRPIFASVLVQYLEDVEKDATTFPVSVQASIADIYSKYG